MGEEPLLQKLKIQEDLESDKRILVNDGDGDGPVTLVLLLTTFTALWGVFSYGTAAGFTSPAQTGMMTGLNLSLAEFSFFGSVLTIGGLMGAAMSGRLADVFGRRGALWVSNSFCLSGWLMIAFSRATWSLDIGRLLLGVAAGVASYVVPVYIVEIAPKKIRGALSAINSLVMCSSVSITFLVGSVISWQKLALLSTVPCVLEYVGLFFIPESPRWLSRNGRVKESEVALQRLRGNNADITKEAAEIKTYMEHLQESKEESVFELFKPRYSRVITSYGLLENYTPISTFFGVLIFLVSIPIGIGGIPWIMVSEMTPINIKGSGGTLCNLTSWSCNWFVSFTFNFLFHWSSSGVFFIYSMISGVGILFVMKMVPETRGRSLEEIQAAITR
ncbi:unnamed protein product [Arabis nemorensis]|uniref:Major facilitator superfamily (MFS) profile domain-containing protein n=1 Tax=Arabis nemorensis TaxID=586526 RepID=A0A565BBK0_9BRAS|nr:unnamed protein product [Arabis nemorensis]